MRVPVLSVLADDPLPRTVQTMLERRIGGLPVPDDDQRLVGRLTLTGVLHEHDLREVVEHGEAARGRGDSVTGEHFFLQGMKAGDLMRPSAGVVLASVPLRAALQRMLDAQVHGLPVVSDGHRLPGVLTISDVLRAMPAAGRSLGPRTGSPRPAR